MGERIWRAVSHVCWALLCLLGVQVWVRTLRPVPGLPLLWLLGLPCPCVTVTPLTRMIDWVSWPLGKNIDKWIIALLKGLAAVKKFSILIEVSLAKIEKVGGPCPSLGAWPFPLFSSGSSAGMGCKVLGSQSSSMCDRVISLPLSGPRIRTPLLCPLIPLRVCSPNSGCPFHRLLLHPALAHTCDLIPMLGQLF